MLAGVYVHNCVLRYIRIIIFATFLQHVLAVDLHEFAVYVKVCDVFIECLYPPLESWRMKLD